MMRRRQALPGGPFRTRDRNSARRLAALSDLHIFSNVTQSACVAPSAGTLNSKRRSDNS
jgi:hypothetical protein